MSNFTDRPDFVNLKRSLLKITNEKHTAFPVFNNGDKQFGAKPGGEDQLPINLAHSKRSYNPS